MALSKEAVEEFKKIYLQEFGEKISDAEAQEMGESLISFFKIIYHPIPKDNKQDPKDNKDLE
jgi:predicted nucleic acid-binding protein